MLSTEIIPSTYPRTRRWIAFCLSILGYACEVRNKPIDGEEGVFQTHRSGNHERDRALDPRLEKEQTDLIKEAIYFLYGKRAIRFFPPRPGTELSNEEFVIPEFSHGSKKDWYSRHYVVVLAEYSWMLSEGEKSYSSLMQRVQDQARILALGHDQDPERREAARTNRDAAQGARQHLRNLGHAERVAAGEQSASGPRSRPMPADTPTTPAANDPYSWAPHEGQTHDSWNSSSSHWGASSSTWTGAPQNQSWKKGKGKGHPGRHSSWSGASGAVRWGAASHPWWGADSTSVVKVAEEAKSFDLSFYLVIITIFACGAVLGGLIGYLIAYIKYHKLTSRDKKKTVAQQTVIPTLQVDDDYEELLDRTKRPSTKSRRNSTTATSSRSRFPDLITITKKGLEGSHIYHREECHVLRSGIYSGTNVLFRKCDICFD